MFVVPLIKTKIAKFCVLNLKITQMVLHHSWCFWICIDEFGSFITETILISQSFYSRKKHHKKFFIKNNYLLPNSISTKFKQVPRDSIYNRENLSYKIHVYILQLNRHIAELLVLPIS